MAQRLTNSQIISAIAAKLADSTCPATIYESKFLAFAEDVLPVINILIPEKSFERDSSDGHYRATHKVVICLYVKGFDPEEMDSTQDTITKNLDELEEYVYSKLLNRFENLGLGKNNINFYLTSVMDEVSAEKTTSTIGKRYLTFELKAAVPVNV